jgi:hypothetical protein
VAAIAKAISASHGPWTGYPVISGPPGQYKLLSSLSVPSGWPLTPARAVAGWNCISRPTLAVQSWPKWLGL